MKCIFFSLVTLTLFSCGAPVMKTVYTNPKPVPRYKKILVIAILPGEELSRESEIESSVINSLAEKGLEGISYADAISIYDTCQPCLDAFYFSLEEKKIDGILTISKLRSSIPVPMANWNSQPAIPFYLDHVWKYKAGQDKNLEPGAGKYTWESILFDLHSLETNKVLQSNISGVSDKKKRTGKILEEITNAVDTLVSKEPVLNKKPKLAF